LGKNVKPKRETLLRNRSLPKRGLVNFCNMEGRRTEERTRKDVKLKGKACGCVGGLGG